MTDEASKKIIIDEDWKSKVEAERESPLHEKPASESAPNPEAAPGKQDEADLPLPPPDLLFLASSLYMQALVALGLIENPMTGKPEVHLPQAKHAIDTLQVLQDKTQGNRTEEETQGLEAMLHEVRMAFVAVQSNR
jgi:hypothetical protein